MNDRITYQHRYSNVTIRRLNSRNRTHNFRMLGDTIRDMSSVKIIVIWCFIDFNLKLTHFHTASVPINYVGNEMKILFVEADVQVYSLREKWQSSTSFHVYAS
jgi:hypothetical protein